MEAWRTGKTKGIIETYSSSDIYNCNETGLFWQMLPESSLGFIREKQPKTRITLFVGSNINGTYMMPTLAISKRTKHCALKETKELPR